MGEFFDDVLSFLSECFKAQTFRSIDYISISANCKIRKVFSMRNAISEINYNKYISKLDYTEDMPRTLDLPLNIYHENLNMNIERVKAFIENEIKINTELQNNISIEEGGKSPK